MALAVSSYDLIISSVFTKFIKLNQNLAMNNGDAQNGQNAQNNGL